jgi:hypothetical protein
MEPEQPEIFQIVCGILQFRQDDKRSDWNYTNSTLRKLQPLPRLEGHTSRQKLTGVSSHRSHVG